MTPTSIDLPTLSCRQLIWSDCSLQNRVTRTGLAFTDAMNLLHSLKLQECIGKTPAAERLGKNVQNYLGQLYQVEDSPQAQSTSD